jgi:hypothetical protein
MQENLACMSECMRRTMNWLMEVAVFATICKEEGLAFRRAIKPLVSPACLDKACVQGAWPPARHAVGW